MVHKDGSDSVYQTKHQQALLFALYIYGSCIFALILGQKHQNLRQKRDHYNVSVESEEAFDFISAIGVEF